MKRRQFFATLTGVMLGSAVMFANPEPVRALQRGKADMYTRCAQACATCKRACDRCTRHCAGMVASGMKEHTKTLHLSEDTAELCGAAARICARRGPMTKEICQACLQACKRCGGECGKYPQMKPMKDCAQACSICAQACQEMVQSL